jgi:hypothetical protein
LEKWEADPEEWIKEEDEEKWKFDVRVGALHARMRSFHHITDYITNLCELPQPCAEAFLKELMKAYGHVIYQVNEYRLHYQGQRKRV